MPARSALPMLEGYYSREVARRAAEEKEEEEGAKASATSATRVEAKKADEGGEGASVSTAVGTSGEEAENLEVLAEAGVPFIEVYEAGYGPAVEKSVRAQRRQLQNVYSATKSTAVEKALEAGASKEEAVAEAEKAAAEAATRVAQYQAQTRTRVVGHLYAPRRAEEKDKAFQEWYEQVWLGRIVPQIRAQYQQALKSLEKTYNEKRNEIIGAIQDINKEIEKGKKILQELAEAARRLYDTYREQLNKINSEYSRLKGKKVKLKVSYTEEGRTVEKVFNSPDEWYSWAISELNKWYNSNKAEIDKAVEEVKRVLEANAKAKEKNLELLRELDKQFQEAKRTLREWYEKTVSKETAHKYYARALAESVLAPPGLIEALKSFYAEKAVRTAVAKTLSKIARLMAPRMYMQVLMAGRSPISSMLEYEKQAAKGVMREGLEELERQLKSVEEKAKLHRVVVREAEKIVGRVVSSVSSLLSTGEVVRDEAAAQALEAIDEALKSLERLEERYGVKLDQYKRRLTVLKAQVVATKKTVEAIEEGVSPEKIEREVTRIAKKYGLGGSEAKTLASTMKSYASAVYAALERYKKLNEEINKILREAKSKEETLGKVREALAKYGIEEGMAETILSTVEKLYEESERRKKAVEEINKLLATVDPRMSPSKFREAVSAILEKHGLVGTDVGRELLKKAMESFNKAREHSMKLERLTEELNELLKEVAEGKLSSTEATKRAHELVAKYGFADTDIGRSLVTDFMHKADEVDIARKIHSKAASVVFSRRDILYMDERELEDYIRRTVIDEASRYAPVVGRETLDKIVSSLLGAVREARRRTVDKILGEAEEYKKKIETLVKKLNPVERAYWERELKPYYEQAVRLSEFARKYSMYGSAVRDAEKAYAILSSVYDALKKISEQNVLLDVATVIATATQRAGEAARRKARELFEEALREAKEKGRLDLLRIVAGTAVAAAGGFTEWAGGLASFPLAVTGTLGEAATKMSFAPVKEMGIAAAEGLIYPAELIYKGVKKGDLASLAYGGAMILSDILLGAAMDTLVKSRLKSFASKLGEKTRVPRFYSLLKKLGRLGEKTAAKVLELEPEIKEVRMVDLGDRLAFIVRETGEIVEKGEKTVKPRAAGFGVMGEYGETLRGAAAETFGSPFLRGYVPEPQSYWMVSRLLPELEKMAERMKGELEAYIKPERIKTPAKEVRTVSPFETGLESLLGPRAEAELGTVSFEAPVSGIETIEHVPTAARTTPRTTTPWLDMLVKKAVEVAETPEYAALRESVERIGEGVQRAGEALKGISRVAYGKAEYIAGAGSEAELLTRLAQMYREAETPWSPLKRTHELISEEVKPSELRSIEVGVGELEEYYGTASTVAKEKTTTGTTGLLTTILEDVVGEKAERLETEKLYFAPKGRGFAGRTAELSLGEALSEALKTWKKVSGDVERYLRSRAARGEYTPGYRYEVSVVTAKPKGRLQSILYPMLSEYELVLEKGAKTPGLTAHMLVEGGGRYRAWKIYKLDESLSRLLRRAMEEGDIETIVKIGEMFSRMGEHEIAAEIMERARRARATPGELLGKALREVSGAEREKGRAEVRVGAGEARVEEGAGTVAALRAEEVERAELAARAAEVLDFGTLKVIVPTGVSPAILSSLLSIAGIAAMPQVPRGLTPGTTVAPVVASQRPLAVATPLTDQVAFIRIAPASIVGAKEEGKLAVIIGLKGGKNLVLVAPEDEAKRILARLSRRLPVKIEDLVGLARLGHAVSGISVSITPKTTITSQPSWLSIGKEATGLTPITLTTPEWKGIIETPEIPQLLTLEKWAPETVVSGEKQATSLLLDKPKAPYVMPTEKPPLFGLGSEEEELATQSEATGTVTVPYQSTAPEEVQISGEEEGLTTKTTPILMPLLMQTVAQLYGGAGGAPEGARIYPGRMPSPRLYPPYMVARTKTVPLPRTVLRERLEI